jgi:hypothetical protein
MQILKRGKALILIAGALFLTACGGGGGGDSGDSGNVSNTAPTAAAGADQSVDELALVNLDGSASSDPDAGTTLTYSWSQTDGTTVTLANADMAQASFDAPDVLAVNTPITLTFQLTVSDGSRSSQDLVDVVVNDVGQGVNSPPTADAGPDQDAVESTIVSLDGTGSMDPDGDGISYSWTQTMGQNVVLSDAGLAEPSFTAPNVAAGFPETLTFELTVDDGSGGVTDTVDITVAEGLSMVTVAGKLFYQQPQANARCNGYNFSDLVAKPVRRLTVELLDDANGVLATGRTLDDGSYSFANIDSGIDVRVRVSAASIEAGIPSWNVQVRDNTSNTGQSLDLRPLYAVQWGLFNSGGNHSFDNDFTATTGWDGSSYTGVQAAAPLSIIDSILDGVILVTTADPSVDMGQLDVFWSINNSLTGTTDYDTGELSTAHYTSNPDGGARNPSLFLRGDAIGRFPDSIINTDEFDRGVILHEWGHFFEDELSRSDSIGGGHAIPGEIEARVAFGEGWGYAIAAIAGNDPILCDTASPANSGWDLNIEDWSSGEDGTHGFFNEMSVAAFLYDLWDTSNDGAGDTGSIGFAPIYETMTGAQKNTDAFTTIFSFGTEVRASLANPADQSLVDDLLGVQNVDTANLDIWGSGQTTLPGGWRDVLPVYTDLPADGSPVELCTNSDLVRGQDGNKPGEWRYLKFMAGSSSRWRIIATASPAPPPTNDVPDPDPDAPAIADRSDPDMWLYQRGNFKNTCPDPQCQTLGTGLTGAADAETLNTTTLSAGTYVIAFNDWRYQDENISSDYPDRICFDITMNPL